MIREAVESSPSPGYIHGHQESVLRSHMWRSAANSAGYLVPHLTEGTSVLDVGCGPGTITLDFARLVAPGRVVGLDTVESVVAKARESVREVSNVEFRTGDGSALDFPDESFDVVHAHQVLQHVTDPVAVLREMGRVCAPGGLVAVRDGDYAGFTWYPEVPELTEWLDLYRRLARANGGEPDAGRRVLAWARQAGFAEAVPSASIWCFATPEDRAYWAGTWSERVLDSAFAAHALAQDLATRADLERISQGWLDWAAHEDAWFAIPHGEILARRQPVAP